MELRLEDLQTEELHTIDAAGATLGRDSRRSSITIPDPGVSGAHARIFSRSGKYFIEDTNSSNGTFVEGTRLRGELELKDGIVISLHKYKFRVTVAANGANESTGLYDPKTVNAGIGNKTTPQGEAPRAMQEARTVMRDEEADDADGEDDAGFDEGSSIHRNPPVGDDDEAPRRRDASAAPRRRDSESIESDSSVRDSGSRRRDVSADDDDDGEDSREISSLGPAFSAGDMQGGLGKALAYYMAAVPKLLFAPVKSTQKLIAEQPFQPLEKMDLVVWAAPPLILGAIISLLASIVYAIVTKTFGVGVLVRPIISGAITVVVGCVVAGWVWHPVLAWWIKLLKGESSPRGRTNMLIGLYTGMALTQIAAGVAVLFALLAVVPVVGPFVGVFPVLIMAAASLVSLYIMYAWHGHFRVMDIVPKIIMVFGVLLIASTAWSVIGVVRMANAARMAAAQAAEAEALVAKAQADAAKLQAQANAGQADDDSAAADTGKPAAKDPVAVNEKPSEAPRPAVTTSDKPSTPPPATPATRPNARPAAATTTSDDPPPRSAASKGGKPTFAELNEHIDAIEKAVSADPSLLARAEGALELYKKLHATQAKYKVKSKDPVAERIRPAELYGALVDTVEDLYDKVAR